MTAPDLTEPAHIEMPPILRRAANRMRLGPQRDAVLCLADELELKRDVSLISHSTLRDAMYAYGDEDAFIDEDDCANDMSARRPAGAGLDSRIMAEPDADEPAHIRMPPILRRAAARRPPGPHRDAILRYAEELEERGDATLVPRATFRAALEAFGAEHEDEL